MQVSRVLYSVDFGLNGILLTFRLENRAEENKTIFNRNRVLDRPRRPIGRSKSVQKRISKSAGQRNVTNAFVSRQFFFFFLVFDRARSV